MAIYYDIVTKYEYEKDGVIKTIFKPTGILKQLDNGMMFIRMNHQPHTEHLVFRQGAEKEELDTIQLE